MTEELEQFLKNLKLRRMLSVYDEQLHAAEKAGVAMVSASASVTLKRGMRRISAGRSVLGFFMKLTSQRRCTELPSQVRSGAILPPRPLMEWQLKQFISAISSPALPA